MILNIVSNMTTTLQTDWKIEELHYVLTPEIAIIRTKERPTHTAGALGFAKHVTHT